MEFSLQQWRVHASGKPLHTTLLDIAINKAVASVGERHLPGASIREGSRSATVRLEDVQVGKHGNKRRWRQFPDFLVVTAFSVFALADAEKAVADHKLN
ncbi:MAG: hypothetical protein ACKPKO_34485, partial [Candidatus Fonsibacter sp.]